MLTEQQQWVEDHTLHKDNNHIRTLHLDDMPPGHHYAIRTENAELLDLKFQNGPVKSNGVNGITSEALLAILINRTTILNNNFPCEENRAAIHAMKTALELFEQRTRDRMARNVEGTNAL